MSPNLRRLVQEVQKETGIDFSQYRKDEFVNRFNHALSEIIGTLRSFITPLSLLPLVLLVVAYLLTRQWMGWAGEVLFWVLGILGCVWMGISLGVLNFVRQTNQTLAHTSDLALDVAETVSADLGSISKQIEPHELPGVLRGVMYGVVIPSVEQLLHKRFGLFARLLTGASERSLIAMAQGIGHAMEQKFQDANPAHDPQGIQTEAWKKPLVVARGALEGVSKTVGGKVLRPAWRVFYTLLLVNMLVLAGVVWWL